MGQYAWEAFTNLFFFLRGAGVGADPSRPPCRKAKELRKERRLQKEQMRHDADGVSSIVSATPPTPTQTKQAKLLEDFLSESLPNNSSSHCFEVSRMQNWSFLLSFYVIWNEH